MAARLKRLDIECLSREWAGGAGRGSARMSGSLYRRLDDCRRWSGPTSVKRCAVTLAEIQQLASHDSCYDQRRRLPRVGTRGRQLSEANRQQTGNSRVCWPVCARAGSCGNSKRPARNWNCRFSVAGEAGGNGGDFNRQRRSFARPSSSREPAQGV